MSAPAQPFADAPLTEEAFARHVSPGKVATYRSVGLNLVMGRRQGIHFSDAFSERQLVNLHCNGGVFNLGHRHPRVVSALRDALDDLDIGNHHLVSGYRAELARRLAATTDDLLPGVVFATAGGEAIDLALKLARGLTGRAGIVSAIGGYHGHTGLALATGDAQYRDPFGPNLPGFVQVPFDDIAALDSAIGEDTAALILEPVPATLGMPIASSDYFVSAERLCHERGAKLIIDEVQTGLGRTGRIWCYQHHGLEPDMLVTGKGLGGGIYPIAATLMRQECLDFFRERPFVHISTFGGAELGCVTALTVLDIIEEPGFREHVEELAALFRDRLASAQSFQLRQRGLMMGLRFSGEGMAMAASKMCFEAGLFAVYANNDTSVLQMLPPLVMSVVEAEEVSSRLLEIFP